MNLLDDPAFKSFIDDYMKMYHASEKVSLDEGRKLSASFFESKQSSLEPIARSEQIDNLKIYIPHENKVLPFLIYFHKGGWVYGSNAESEHVCRRLANHLDCNVVSVDYRLAPEHPFPQGLDDCYSALEWVAKHFDQKIIVCGESAGGNLAAAVALMARNKNGPKISGQILINPVITSRIDDKVYRQAVDQYFLTKPAMKYFWSLYIKNPEDLKNPYASLDCEQNLHGLPPTVIVTSEYDPLKKEAQDYAKKLSDAGVPTISYDFPGVIHCFLDLPLYTDNQKIGWIKEIKTMAHTLGILP